MRKNYKKGDLVEGILLIEDVKRKNPTKRRCRFMCKCGNEFESDLSPISLKRTTSCGCSRKGVNNKNTQSEYHISHPRLANTLGNMIRRCKTKSGNHGKNYFQKGIRVCDEWLSNKESFYKWALDNGYNNNMTIERIDNDKGYNPSNCKWIPLSFQSKNRNSNKLSEKEREEIRNSKQKAKD